MATKTARDPLDSAGKSTTPKMSDSEYGAYLAKSGATINRTNVSKELAAAYDAAGGTDNGEAAALNAAIDARKKREQKEFQSAPEKAASAAFKKGGKVTRGWGIARKPKG